MELGADGEDIRDVAYKLLCPVLREQQKEATHSLEFECPYMRDVRTTAILARRQQSI
jgi:hypothetical protein